MIIGLTGKKGSGKDTAGAYLVDHYGFTRISFADKLKQSAAALWGIDPGLWDELKNDSSVRISISRDVSEKWFDTGVTGPTGQPYSWHHRTIASVDGRKFLQAYGTESHRDIFGCDFWVNAAIKDIDPKGNYVFTDVRFDNEAIAIKNLNGVIIEVERKSLSNGDLHVSEAGLSSEYIDGILTNNSTIDHMHSLIDVLVSVRINGNHYRK